MKQLLIVFVTLTSTSIAQWHLWQWQPSCPMRIPFAIASKIVSSRNQRNCRPLVSGERPSNLKKSQHKVRVDFNVIKPINHFDAIGGSWLIRGPFCWVDCLMIGLFEVPLFGSILVYFCLSLEWETWIILFETRFLLWCRVKVQMLLLFLVLLVWTFSE